MIALSLPAKMVCDDPSCKTSLPVALALTGAGGLVFRPLTGVDGWQVLLPSGNPMAPFVTRCPAHASAIVSPVISSRTVRPDDGH